MKFFNNISTTENLIKLNNILSQRILGKRSNTERTNNFLQSLAERAGTSLELIVHIKKEIAKSRLNFLVLNIIIHLKLINSAVIL